jgi:endonuclease/exonuclease/phosphatase family metal-dependent hydrolase
MLIGRRISAIAIGLTVVAGIYPAHADEPPRALVSVPGQVKIVSINARQNAVLGKKRFEDMFELTQAFRNRPPAFDGGYTGGVTAPDVIGLQEIRTSNVEIFEHILRQRFPHRFRIVGFEDAASPMIYNPDTVTPVGEVSTWEDVCLGDEASGGRTHRFYQLARFTDNRTGTPFAVAAFHMPKNFGGTEPNCYIDNIMELRAQLEDETGATFIVGDFNKRSVQTALECDGKERSEPFHWYETLTAPADGRAYVDAARRYARKLARPMTNQWTHEQRKRTEICDGRKEFRRSRIDYIFANGAALAEASADNPGWAGVKPGTKSGEHKYSDHRFVWARYVLTGPPQPLRPGARKKRGGEVDLSWSQVNGAVEYVIYRAIRQRGFDKLATVGAKTLTFNDVFTEHGVTYRYKIAAIGADSGQGVESGASFVEIDSQGPKVLNVSPRRGAIDVDRRANIKVTFDEGVRPESVTQDRIRLYRGGTRLSGTLRQKSARVLIFNPTFPMKAGREHKVAVKPVTDRLRNVGGGAGWTG